jgi:hypothetical protein
MAVSQDVLLRNLERAVNRAADTLASRGIPPTLARIEMTVKGPRRQLVWLLEEWATRFASGEHQFLATKRQLDLDPLSRSLDQKRVGKMAGSAAAQRVEAALTRPQTDACATRVELEREIVRARDRLRALKARSSDGRAPPTQLRGIDKARRRLTALEIALSKLSSARGTDTRTDHLRTQQEFP